MGKTLKIGNAEVKIQSYDDKCIFMGKKDIHCLVYNKELREKEKNLTKEKRCQGFNKKCEFFAGSSPFVPTYDEHYLLPQKESEILAYALSDKDGKGDNVLIFGRPGTGKSSLVKQIAAILNWGVEQFSCSEETTSAKIIGQWIVVGKSMQWIDGCITNAMKNGFILLEDEADFMRPELRGEVHGIMEEEGSVTLTSLHPKTGQPFREIITKHPSFRWISTANTIGYGDDLFVYHGTQYMNAASRDRYEIILQFDYRTPEEELEIVTTKTKIDPIVAGKMIEIANICRSDVNEDMVFQFSLRRLLAWARYWNQTPPEVASTLAVLNYCNQADRHTVKSLIRTHLNIET